MTGLEIVSVLEQKIEGLISYVTDLEAERSRLIGELEDKETVIRELHEKIEALEGERADVGNRIENLLEKIANATVGDEKKEITNINDNSQNEGAFEFAD